jgi:hypothetical protein
MQWFPGLDDLGSQKHCLHFTFNFCFKREKIDLKLLQRISQLGSTVFGYVCVSFSSEEAN